MFTANNTNTMLQMVQTTNNVRTMKTATKSIAQLMMKSLALLMMGMAFFVGGVKGQYSGTGTFTQISSLASLSDGYYVIAYGTTFAMNNTNSGGNTYFGNTAITPSSGVITNPPTSIVWKITTVSGNIKTIYNEAASVYVSFPSGGGNVANTAASVAGTTEQWTFAYPSTTFTLTNVGSNTRLLQYNTSSPRFACYTGTQQNITLYQMPPATNYFWNGGNAANNTNNIWDNNTTKNWGISSGATFTANTAPGVVWPSSGAYNANFSSTVTAAKSVTIPATISVAPSRTIIGASGYSFATSGSSAITLGGSVDIGGGTSQTTTFAPIAAAPLTLSGVISNTNAGNLTFAGAGTTTLSGTNTYSGGTILSSGQLNVNNATALGTGALTISGTATIDNTSGSYEAITNALNINSSFTFGNSKSLSQGTGAITLGTSPTITVNGASTDTLTLGGLISGAYNIVKNGTGVLAITNGSNAYTGTTTVNGGTLTNLGVGKLGGQVNTIYLNNGTMNSTASFVSDRSIDFAGTTSTIDLPNGVTWTNYNTGGTNIANGGQCLVSGSGPFNKTGAGTFLFSASNTTNHTYNGLNITGGTVIVNKETDLGAVPGSVNSSYITLGGGTLSFGSGFNGVSVNANRGMTLSTGTSNTLDVAASTSVSYGGIIAGSGSLVKTSAGTLTLTRANTYSGSTTISAGTLKLGNTGDATNTPLGTGSTSVTSGAVLDLNGYTLAKAVGLTINGTGISSAGAITNSSATGATYSGAISLGSNSSVGTSSGNITLSGVLSDGGSGYTLTKVGTGTITFSGTNTYTGATTVSGGTLQLNKSGGATLSSSTATSVSGGTLQVSSNQTLSSLTLSGGNLTVDAGVTLTISGPFTISSLSSTITNNGTIILNGTGTGTSSALYVNVSSGNTFNLPGAVTLNSGKRLTINTGILNITGTLTDNGGSYLGNSTSFFKFAASAGYVSNYSTSPAIPTALWDAASTVTVQGVTATMPTGLGQTFGKFTWNCASQSAFLAFNNASFTTAGTFTVTNTGNGANGLYLINDATNRTYSFNALTINGGYLYMTFPSSGTAGIATVGVTNALTVSSGLLSFGYDNNNSGNTLNGYTSTANNYVYSGILNLGGNLNITGGTVTGNTGYWYWYGAINFTSGSHTVVSSTSNAFIDFYALNGATVTLGNNITLSSTSASRLNGFFVNSGATLNTSTYSILDAGGFTNFQAYAGSTIITANAAGINATGSTGAIQTATRGFSSGANFEFQGASTGNFITSTSTSIGGSNYYQVNNLTINRTSAAVSQTQYLAVNGTLTFSNSSSLAINGYGFAINGSISGTSAITGGTGSSLYIGDIGSAAALTLPSISDLLNLSINRASGVSLGGALALSSSGVLTLTAGKLTTASAITINNTSTSAITGGSSTTYVSGPILWTLPASLASGSTYNYPIGTSGGYYPFSLVNPTTGAGSVTAQVQAFAANPGGSIDATIYSKSTTEYWQMTTSGNFTNTSVSITRPSAISSNNVVASSATVGGTYTSLAGTASTYSVTSSSTTSTARIFVLAQAPVITVGTLSPTSVTTYSGTASSNMSFTVSGTGLTANLVVTPPSGFEVSTSTNSGFASSLTFTPSSGTVNTTTIYVRIASSTIAGTYSGNIACTSDNATTQNAVISNSVVSTIPSYPNLTISGIPTDNGNTCPNSPATSIQYTITNSGSTDAAGVSVISDNAQFVVSGLSSTSITANGGTATYLVTFTPTSAGSKSATITVSSTTSGSNTTTSSLTGTGITPVTSVVSTNAATAIADVTATLNGNVTTLGVCPATTEKGFVYSLTATNSDPLVNGTGVTKTAVAGIATGAYTLDISSLSSNSGYTFKSYLFDGTSYTYGTATTFTTLATAPSTQPTSLSRTAVTTTGMTLGWSAASGGAAGYIVLRTTASGTTYPNTNPVTGTTYTVGVTLGNATVEYVGSSISAAVNSTLTNALQYSYGVYSYNGSGSSIAYNTTSPLQGQFYTLATKPTTQSSLALTSYTTTSATLAITNGNGGNNLIVVSPTAAVSQNPVDGASGYSAGSNVYGAGTNLGSSNYIVLMASTATTSVTVTGLTAGVAYNFAIYSYNGVNGGGADNANYLTTSPGLLTVVTLGTPVATDASSITQSGFTANWGAVTGATSYALDVYKITNNASSLSEPFATNVPNGWSGTASGGYTSAGNYGAASPSTGFANNGEYLTSPTLAASATQLSFWIKGNSTNATSALLIQGWNGSSWVRIDSITNSIPISGTTYTYNASSTPTLLAASNYTQFKFTYTKSSGNLAFDDVAINYGSSSTSYVSGFNNQNVGNVTTYNVTGLSSSTAYNYVVRAVTASNTSASSNVITATTSNPVYYSKSSGSLDVLGTWGTNSDGTGSAPSNFTAANATYNMVNNTTPTIAATWTVSGSGSKVVIGNGGTAINFTIPSAYAYTGTVDVTAGSTLTLQNSTIPTFGTLNATSTVIYDGGTAQTVTAGTYGNLTIQNIAATKSLGGNIVLGNSNTFTLATGTTLTASTYTLTFGTSGTATINGKFQTANTNGFSGTASTSIVSTNTPTITLGTGSTVEYNSTSAQTITTANPYYNLLVSGITGVKTFNASPAIAANGSFILNSSCFADIATTSMSFGTGASATINGTIYTQKASNGISGAATSSFSSTNSPSVTFALGSTVIYNRTTGAQDVSVGTYGNLTISTTGNTATLLGNVLINGGNTLTVNSTLAAGNYTISQTGTGTASISVAGTISTTNLNGLSGAANTTITTSNTSLTLGAASTVDYASASTQVITPLTYNNITNSGNGARTIGTGTTIVGGTLTTGTGAYTISGTLQLSSASTLTITTNAVLTFSGASAVLTNNGATITGATATSLIFGATTLYTHNVNGGTVPTASWDINSTCNITGVTGGSPVLPAGFSQSFGNYTWNCTGMTTGLNLNNTLTDIRGNFNLTSSGGVFVRLNNTSDGNSTLTVGGNLTIGATGGLNLNYGATTGGLGTLNLSGNLSIASGGLLTQSSTAYKAIINFNGNGSKQFNNAGTFNNTNGPIDINVNAGTLTLASNLNLNNYSFNASNVATVTVANNATLDFSTFSIVKGTNTTASGFASSVTPAFIASSGSTIISSNTNGLVGTSTGSIQVATRTFTAGANYILNGATTTPFPTSGLGNPANVTLGANVTLNAAITATGTVALSTFTLDLGGNSTSAYTLTGTGTIQSASGTPTLTLGAGNGTYSFGGTIQNGSGTVAITKSGSGTITLSGTNTYTGATTVSGGILKAGSTAAFGTNSAVSLANTTGVSLDITGYNTSIASLATGGSTGGNVTLGAATLTLAGSTNTSYAGVISGTGAITKSGAATQTLTGTNTYTGLTTVSGGTLKVSGTNTLPATCSVSVSGGVFEVGSAQTINAFSMNSGGLTVDASTTVTFNGTYNVTAGTVNAYSGFSAGTLATSSTIVLSGGSISFPGSHNVVLTNSTLGAGYMGNLTINTQNATDSITLKSSLSTVALYGTLTLTKGIVKTATGADILAAGAVSGGSANSYVNGPLGLSTPIATTYSFPIGKSGVYRPILFTYSSAPSPTSIVIIEQFEGNFPGTIPNDVSFNRFGNRYYNILQNTSSLAYTISLNNSGATPTGTVSIIRRDGASVTTNYNSVGSLVASTYYPTSSSYTASTNLSNDVAIVETAIPLTITGATTANKVYDGNATASVSGATLSGLVSGDNVTLVPVYNYSQNTPGTGLAITSTSTLSGTNAAAYTLSQPSLTARNITAGTVGQWLGVVSTSYTNVANWQSYSVPTGADNITIPTGTTYLPVLAADTTVNNLSIASGTTLGLGGNKLTINGTVSGTGTISGSASSSLTIGGSAGTLYLTPASNTIKNLTLNSSSSVTLGNAVNITAGASAGIVTIGSGATLTTGGNLSLKSDLSGSARIAQSAGSIVGDVTVERYIPSKAARKYSFIGSAVGGVSIQNSWQKNFYITGSGSGGTICGTTTGNGLISTDKYNTNGFDVSQAASASMYYYGSAMNGGSHWTPIPTTTDNLVLGKGYRINIRGDRTQGTCTDQLASGTPTAPVAVTLSAKGTVGAGDVVVDLTTKSVPANLYTLLANPYPSPIDFDAFRTDNANASTGITGNMWLYSPNSSNGNYTTYSGGTALNVPTGDDGYVNNLESGQAFFVQSASGSSQTVTFKEAHKIGTTPNRIKFFGTNPVKQIRVGFTNLADTRLDEIVVKFTPSGTKDYNVNDAVSFGGGSQQIVALKGSDRLAVSYYPDTLAIDTVTLGISSTTAGSFKLAFSDFAALDTTQSIILFDKYLSVKNDVRANPSYGFNITSDTASKGNNRFALIFTNAAANPLPVNFTNIGATKNGNSVAVNWHVTSEINIVSYQVERSTDAKSFVSINTVKASNSSSYQSDDNQLPEDATSLYYRIKAVEKNGTVIYSNIVKLSTDNSSISTINIYPNPVKDKINVSIAKSMINSNSYHVKVLSLAGKVVAEFASISSVNNKLGIPAAHLASGVYMLDLTDENGNSQVKKFIKE